MYNKIKKPEQTIYVVLFVVFACAIFWAILTIIDMREASHIADYSGLVRGVSQRVIKLEIAGEPNDKLITYVDEVVYSLKNGEKKYGLSKISNIRFRNSLEEQIGYWDDLKYEISYARKFGWEKSDIIRMSEFYYELCDKTTSIAEDYTEDQISDLKIAGIIIISIILIFSVVLGRKAVESAVERRKNAILNQRVYYDEATGVRNRNFFDEFFQEMAVSTSSFSFCYLDLDCLKVINDTYGHAEGDLYIKSFVDCVKREIRKTDEMFRLGGDEFAIFMPGCSETVAIRQMKMARDNFIKDNLDKYEASFSYGVVSVNENEKRKVDDIIEEADKKMYEKKIENKKNRK